MGIQDEVRFANGPEHFSTVHFNLCLVGHFIIKRMKREREEERKIRIQVAD